AGQSSANFSLNVPSQGGPFDLFASAIDLFMGVPEPFGGHTIVTQSNISAPAACTTAVAPGGLFSELMDCVGHGSITGPATNPDSGTTGELAKNGVQLVQAAVGPPTPASTPGNSYSLCAPPDNNYTVQRLELEQSNMPLPTTTTVGTPASVANMPTPEP